MNLFNFDLGVETDPGGPWSTLMQSIQQTAPPEPEPAPPDYGFNYDPSWQQPPLEPEAQFQQQYGVPSEYIPDLIAEGVQDPSLGGQDEWQRYGGLTDANRRENALLTPGSPLDFNQYDPFAGQASVTDRQPGESTEAFIARRQGLLERTGIEGVGYEMPTLGDVLGQRTDALLNVTEPVFGAIGERFGASGERARAAGLGTGLGLDTPEEGRAFGEGVAGAVTPQKYWEIGAAFAPGVGEVPGLTSLAGKAGAPLVRGGLRLGAEVAQQGPDIARGLVRGAMPEPSLSTYGAGVPPLGDDLAGQARRAVNEPAPAPVTPPASTAAPSPMETPAGAGQPQVLRLAVREGSTAPSPEGLAASRGAETITDPTGVRILKEGEQPAAGERLMHHGTAGPIEGGVLRQGAEIIPDPNDAQAFANVSARMGPTQQARPQVLAQTSGGVPSDRAVSPAARSAESPPAATPPQTPQAAPSARTGTAPPPAGLTPASSAQGGGTPPPPPAAPPPGGIPPVPPTSGPLPNAIAPNRPRGTGIDRALKIAEAAIIEPGSEAPGLARKVAGVVNPSVAQPRAATVANQARAGVRASEYTDLSRAQVGATREATRAYDAAKPKYIGPADNPVKDTFVDFMERPWLYDPPSPALAAARQHYDETMDQALLRIRDEYDVAIDPVYPRGPNGEVGSYVPHMQTEEARNALSVGGRNIESTGKVSIQKERGYPSLGERMAGDKFFKPELDPLTLAESHARQLAEAAARETYKAGIGGKTKLEVLEEINPALKTKRDNVTKLVQSLRGKLVTTSAQRRTAVNQGRSAQTQLSALERRMTAIQEHIDELGDEYGPELSHLSRELLQMTRQQGGLGRVVNTAGEAIADASVRRSGLQADLNKAVNALDELRRAVRTGGTGNYVLDPVTNRYMTAEMARASKNVSTTSLGDDLAEGALKALEETRVISLGAGDLSVLTLGRGMLGAASHPTVLVTNAGKLAKAARQSDEAVWSGVDQANLSLYQQINGTPVMRGGGATELRGEGQGLERLANLTKGGKATAPLRVLGRGIRAINETIHRITEFGRFKAWEADFAILRKTKPELEAATEAMRGVDIIAPALNLTQSGYSTARRRLVGAPFSSLSFTLSPAMLAKEMTAGVAQMTKALATGKTPAQAWASVQGRQQIAMVRGTQMIGTLSAISAASAIAFDDRPRVSDGQKALDAMNPLSGQFWNIYLPGGRKIPIGGPIRSAVRATAGMASGDLSAGTKYVRGRFQTAISTPIDLIANADYRGREIMTGGVANKVKQALLYGLERANITTSGIGEALRTGEGADIGSIAEQTAAAYAGGSLYERSPFRERDIAAIRAIDSGDVYRDGTGNEVPYPTTYLDKDGNEQQVKTYADLKAASPLAAEDLDSKNVKLNKEIDPRQQKVTQEAEKLKASLDGRQQARDHSLLTSNPSEWRRASSEDQRAVGIRLDQLYVDAGDYAQEERSLLDVANRKYHEAIEAASEAEVVNWDEVDKAVAGMSEDEQRLLFETRLKGETEARKQYMRDLEVLSPYFEQRDAAWNELRAGDPTLQSYESFDSFRDDMVKQVHDAGIGWTEARSKVDAKLEKYTAAIGRMADVYLAENADALLPLLDRYDFYIPSRFQKYVRKAA